MSSNREIHYIQKVVSYRIKDGGVSFSCRTNQGKKAEVKISPLSEHIFRIQMQARGKIIDKKTAMMVREKWPKVSLGVKQWRGKVILKTGSFEMEVNKNPWQISIFDTNRRLILQESIFDFIPGPPEGRIVYPMGFSIDKKGAYSVFESFSLQPDEHFYGLGEKFGSLDKRGQKIISWTLDPMCLNTTDWAYKNIPFFMSSRGYGIFVNSSYKIIYEMGSRSFISYSFLVEDSLMDMFLIFGNFKKILSEYTLMTGRAPVPPKWSFGLWMSKARYETRKEIEEVSSRLRKFKIPCDVIHLDAAWEKSFRKRKDSAFDYEWDEKAFPCPQDMIKKLKENGFKLSLATNPYINRQTSRTYREAIKGGYLANGKNGKPICSSPLRLYSGNLPKGTEDLFQKNPIYYYFIDFTNPETRAWLEDRLGRLLRMGVAVFKTDYGELSPEGAVYYNGMSGKEMHNLYPLLYNQTVFEITKKHTGYGLVWGRSGYAGSQRYPVTWAGDSQGNFPAMACVLQGGLSYGLSGVPFWSHDIGGFTGKPDPVLYIRWAQFGLLSSHARCHGVTPREPWNFGTQALRIFRCYVRLRYRLIPYLYSYACIAHQTGLPLMRALVLEYQDDPNVYNLGSEYLLGEELLIAPVFDGTNKRNVYLPEGKWVDYWKGKEYEGPVNISYHAPIEILPIFVKKDSIIPLAPEMNYVGEKPWDPLTLDIYLERKAEFMLYDDEEKIKFRAMKDKKQIIFEISPSNHHYILCFNGITSSESVVAGGKLLRHCAGEKEWRKVSHGWYSNTFNTKVKFRTNKKATVIVKVRNNS